MSDTLTLDRLRDDIAGILGEPLTAAQDDENLLDLGLDSIRVMSLIEKWRAAGYQPSFLDLVQQPTVAQWWPLVTAAAAPATGAAQ